MKGLIIALNVVATACSLYYATTGLYTQFQESEKGLTHASRLARQGILVRAAVVFTLLLAQKYSDNRAAKAQRIASDSLRCLSDSLFRIAGSTAVTVKQVDSRTQGILAKSESLLVDLAATTTAQQQLVRQQHATGIEVLGARHPLDRIAVSGRLAFQ